MDKYLPHIKVLLPYLLIQPIVVVVLCVIYFFIDKSNLLNFMNKEGLIFILLSLIIYALFLVFQYKPKIGKVNIHRLVWTIFTCFSVSSFFNSLYHLNVPEVLTNFNLITFLSTCFVGPIIEEIIFRYVIYHLFRKEYSKNKSILITSILFGVLHFNLKKGIFAFVIGFILNKIYVKTNNMIYPIIGHIIINIIGYFFVSFHIFILLLSVLAFILHYRKIMTS